MKRVHCVVGTRPEAIKMAPVVLALRRRGLDVEIVATSQHRDPAMLDAFLRPFGLAVDLRLPPGRVDLLGALTDILDGLGRVFGGRRPALVLAAGDTTSVLAAAIAARKSGAAFGHVEAGLRAGSRELPEEEHRIAADVFADLLFAPTAIAAANLARERVNGAVFHTGNPILDALRMHAPAVEDPAPEAPRRLLVTVHRQETVDDPRTLGGIAAAVAELAREHPVDWPVHPRTRTKAEEHGIALAGNDRVRATGPISHRELLTLLARAALVLTDSGGVQEEAAILGTPCVCIRRHSERPETFEAGVAILGGLEAVGLLDAARRILADRSRWARPVPHLYGDGDAADRIADACVRHLASP